MKRIRLGKAERAIVRAWHKERLAKKSAIINANLDAPRPESVRYASADIRMGYVFYDPWNTKRPSRPVSGKTKGYAWKG